jgi:hypothetical protein
MGEQMFTMKYKVFDRPSAVSDHLIQNVDQEIGERRRFTISEFSYEFPEISPIPLYEDIAARICYYMFRTKWVPKMLTGVHKTQRMAYLG